MISKSKISIGKGISWVRIFSHSKRFCGEKRECVLKGFKKAGTTKSFSMVKNLNTLWIISKCPKCGGAKEPPKTAIFFIKKL